MVELHGTQSTPRHRNQNVTSGDMKTSRPEKNRNKAKRRSGVRSEIKRIEKRSGSMM